MVAVPILAVLGIALVGPKLEQKLLYRQTSPTEAYRAALAYLKTEPDLATAVSFSQQKESVIERWGPVRFRIAGYVDLQTGPNGKAKDSYSCVLHYNGADRWEVEDLHIERVQ